MGKKRNAPEILPFDATLAYAFKGAGGKLTAINGARLLQEEDTRMKKFVYAFDRLSTTDQNNIALEDLCALAEISAKDFLKLVVPALWERNVDISKIIAATHHPEIVEATIKAAKGQFGMPDRKMLHDHMGFLPLPKGQTINIDSRHLVIGANGKGSVSIEEGALSLPSFEEDAIEGAQVIRGDAGVGKVGQKAIAPVIDAEIVSVQPAED